MYLYFGMVPKGTRRSIFLNLLRLTRVGVNYVWLKIKSFVTLLLQFFRKEPTSLNWIESVESKNKTIEQHNNKGGSSGSKNCAVDMLVSALNQKATFLHCTMKVNTTIFLLCRLFYSLGGILVITHLQRTFLIQEISLIKIIMFCVLYNKFTARIKKTL